MKMNYKYGRLDDNTLIYAPNKLIINNEQVFNASADIYKECGYLPIVNTEAPEATEQYYYMPYYVIENETIIQKWEQYEVEIIDNATEADYLEALARLGVE